jgi:hypothetical protein
MASNHFDSGPRPFASQTSNQRAFSFEPPASSTPKKSKLQADFQPSDYSVVCGRGKHNFNHVGNRRFRILASTFTERYSVSDSKAAKSAIVSELIAVIRQAGGQFCKYESGAWFEVGNHYAREKAGALLRDCCTLNTHPPTSPRLLVGGIGGKSQIKNNRPAKSGSKSKKLATRMTSQQRRRAGEGARIPWGSSIGWKRQTTFMISMSFRVDYVCDKSPYRRTACQ